MEAGIGLGDGVGPLVEPRIAPGAVRAGRREVGHVEVQGGRLVGEVDELAGAGVRRGVGEEVDERDCSDDAAPTGRARGHGRPFEVAREREERGGLGGVEGHLFAVVIEDQEGRLGHAPDGSARRTRPPQGPARPSPPQVRQEPATGSGTSRPAPSPGGGPVRGPGGLSLAAMRALMIQPGNDSRGTLAVVEVPRPVPGPDDVLVRVHGAGINRADLLQLAGHYPAPPGVPPDIPGLEFAGVVESVGAAVAAPIPGDRVYGIVGGGAQAEFITVRADQCAIVPAELDLVEAGGVPEAFITAHDALRTCAGLEPGERVLVHAAGSGVGTAVVQLARAFDCEITGTARTATKLEQARELGLDHPILVPSGSPFDPHALATAITEAAGPIDVVVDLVGGDYLVTDVGAAAQRARIVLVGTLAGVTAPLPIHLVMSKRLTLVGTVLRARSLAEKATATEAFATETARWWDDSTLRPIVDRVVPLADAPSAYELVASDSTFGKVILDTR